MVGEQSLMASVSKFSPVGVRIKCFVWKLISPVDAERGLTVLKAGMTFHAPLGLRMPAVEILHAVTWV